MMSFFFSLSYFLPSRHFISRSENNKLFFKSLVLIVIEIFKILIHLYINTRTWNTCCVKLVSCDKNSSSFLLEKISYTTIKYSFVSFHEKFSISILSDRGPFRFPFRLDYYPKILRLWSSSL